MFSKKPKGVESNTQKQLIPAWIWMIVGSLLTLVFVAFLYFLQPFKISDEKPPVDGLTDRPIQADNVTDNENQQTEVNQSGDYQFYDLLPEQEVTPIPNAAIPENEKKVTHTKADVTIVPKNNPKPVQKSPSTTQTQNQPKASQQKKPEQKIDHQEAKADIQEFNDPIEQIIEEKTSFILQINSYGTAEEADSRRAEVLLAGIDAKVLKSTMGDGAILYQVVSKAYDSKQGVFLAQERLKASGIDALVVERRL